MRTLKQPEFADETNTVFWCACERCGAPGPCITAHPGDDDVGELLRIRTCVEGICGACGMRPIRRRAPQERDAVV